MIQSSEHIHWLKATLAVKDAVLESLKGASAESAKRDLERIIFLEAQDFVTVISRILDREFEK